MHVFCRWAEKYLSKLWFLLPKVIFSFHFSASVLLVPGENITPRVPEISRRVDGEYLGTREIGGPRGDSDGGGQRRVGGGGCGPSDPDSDPAVAIGFRFSPKRVSTIERDYVTVDLEFGDGRSGGARKLVLD